MVFKRTWDSSCPRVWDCWFSSGGTKWVIQDLPEEDYEQAIQIMVDEFIPEEPMSVVFGVSGDLASVEGLVVSWKKHCLPQKMSLACYAEKDGVRTLAGLNFLYVKTKYGYVDPEAIIPGKSWQKLFSSQSYIDRKWNMFDYLNTDVVLCDVGLTVVKEFRGAKLGARILKAREPLCQAYRITAASTLFTSPAAQYLAGKVGYHTVVKVTYEQLAKAGFEYPRTDDVLQVMVKRFQSKRNNEIVFPKTVFEKWFIFGNIMSNEKLGGYKKTYNDM